jgi:hypothetical protein
MDFGVNIGRNKIQVHDTILDKIEFCAMQSVITVSIANNEDEEIVIALNGKDVIFIEDETFIDLKEVTIPLHYITSYSITELYDLSISGE